MIGAKSCPIMHGTTGFVVVRGHGPVPEWLKAWAYQSPLWEITMMRSVEQQVAWEKLAEPELISYPSTQRREIFKFWDLNENG